MEFTTETSDSPGESPINTSVCSDTANSLLASDSNSQRTFVARTSTPPSSPSARKASKSPTKRHSPTKAAPPSASSSRSENPTSSNGSHPLTSISRSRSSLGGLLMRSKSTSSFPQRGLDQPPTPTVSITSSSSINITQSPTVQRAPTSATDATAQIFNSTAHDRPTASTLENGTSPFRTGLNGVRSSLGAGASRVGRLMRTTSDVHDTLKDRALKKRSRPGDLDHGAEGDEDAVEARMPSAKVSRFR
jgi:hypothetical protein